MIVAIDGPAGSGKSTVANRIAAELSLSKLDTGAMFRTVAFVAHARGIDLDDEDAVCGLAGSLAIRFQDAPQGPRVLADGRDVSAQIRTPEVDRIVSKVSAYPGVRRALLACQRSFAEGRDVVAEGRDIGTVVFPDAQVKVFLPPTRASAHAGASFSAMGANPSLPSSSNARSRRRLPTSSAAIRSIRTGRPRLFAPPTMP